MSATEDVVDNDSKIASPSGGLFPAYTQTDGDETRSTLFPAYNTDSLVYNTDGKPQDARQTLDWLENRSFGKDTAAVLGRLQKETEISSDIQERSSDDDISSDEVISTKDRKRPLKEGEFDRDRVSKKKKKKHKKHKKKHNKKGPEEEDVHYKEKEKFFEPNQGKIFLDEIRGLAVGDAYRVDRSADNNNWTYGSLYKLHIAKYRRLGSSCVGLTAGQSISWLSKPGRTNKKHLLREERYYSKENVKCVAKSISEAPQELVTGSATETTFKDCSNLSFLPLENIESRDLYKVLDMTSRVNPLGVYDSATSSYLQGKSTDKMKAKILSEETPTKPSQVSQPSKTAFFNRVLRENPTNVKMWLEFVKFQDFNSQLTAGNVEGSEMDKLHHTSTKVTEKKLAILEKALKANPASIELKMTQLELSRQILEPEEILRRWNQLLFTHQGQTTLWLHYILFVQSQISQFTVSKTTKCYHTCLGKLFSIINGTVYLVDDDRPKEEDLLMIFYQYCCFLKQTGHTEKAVASMQALVEFNIFSPDLVKGIPHADKIAVFESFWDSGVARFGESGAKGWAHWLQNKDAIPEMPILQGEDVEIEEAIVCKDQPVWKTWLEMEAHREAVHWLPWRPDVSENQTDDDCEDPDRLVLVDDITPVLFTFDKQDLRFDLIVLFLRFIGVDAEFETVGLWDYINNSQVFLQTVKDTGLQPREGIFLSGEKCHFAENLKTFVRNIVKQSLTISADDQKTKLILLLLDFEVQLAQQNCDSQIDKNKSKELRKLAKGFLREEENRNNLMLWSWYAKLEHSLGKTQESLKVLETALSMQSETAMSQDSLCAGKLGLYSLCLTYVQINLDIPYSLEFTMGKKRLPPSSETVKCIINALDCLADGARFNKADITSRKPSPPTILKTRRKFQEHQKSIQASFADLKSTPLNSGDDQKAFVVVTWCAVLYDYCTGNLESASVYIKGLLSECDKTITSCPRNGQGIWQTLKRNIYIMWLKLVIFHQTTEVCPLSKLQAVLDTALSDFPEDKGFLKVFTEVETQSFITGRLRRYFDRVVKSSTTPYPAVFYCLAEIRRHIALLEAKTGTEDCPVSVRGETGVVHRLRSLLERVLQQPHSQHCVLLWRQYMHFEVEFGERSRAKGLFYRALQNCPWSKTLYKDAVSLFPGQLQELVDLMMEKELRVQIPVEEIHILRGTEDVGGESHPVEGELYAKLMKDIPDDES